MHRVILAFALIMVLSAGVVTAEQSITLNPIAWILRVYHVQYEKKIDNNSSYIILAGLRSMDDSIEQQTGALAGLGYRRYFGGAAPQGVFVEGLGLYDHTDYTCDDCHLSASVVTLSADVYAGIKLIFERGVTAEAGIGVSSTFYSADTGYVTVTPGGITPAVKFSMGYSW